MGHDHEGDPDLGLDGLELDLHLQAELAVQRPQRLVQQQHPGAVDQGPGQGDPLALAARELGGSAVAEVVKADLGQRGRDPGLALGPPDPADPQAVPDVAGHAHVREQGVVLEDGVDVAFVGGPGGDVDPVQVDGALGGQLEAATMRRVLVLPDPEGPSRVSSSPSRMSRSIPSTAVICHSVGQPRAGRRLVARVAHWGNRTTPQATRLGRHRDRNIARTTTPARCATRAGSGPRHLTRSASRPGRSARADQLGAGHRVEVEADPVVADAELHPVADPLSSSQSRLALACLVTLSSASWVTGRRCLQLAVEPAGQRHPHRAVHAEFRVKAPTWSRRAASSRPRRASAAAARSSARAALDSDESATGHAPAGPPPPGCPAPLRARSRS